MVIRVVQQFHDYEPSSYYIDPTLLRDSVIAEKAIKDELNEHPNDHEIHITLSVRDFPEIDGNSEELMMPAHARVNDSEVESVMIVNQLIWIRMICE